MDDFNDLMNVLLQVKRILLLLLLLDNLLLFTLDLQWQLDDLRVVPSQAHCLVLRWIESIQAFMLHRWLHLHSKFEDLLHSVLETLDEDVSLLLLLFFDGFLLFANLVLCLVLSISM